MLDVLFWFAMMATVGAVSCGVWYWYQTDESRYLDGQYVDAAGFGFLVSWVIGYVCLFFHALLV